MFEPSSQDSFPALEQIPSIILPGDGRIPTAKPFSPTLFFFCSLPLRVRLDIIRRRVEQMMTTANADPFEKFKAAQRRSLGGFCACGDFYHPAGSECWPFHHAS